MTRLKMYDIITEEVDKNKKEEMLINGIVLNLDYNIKTSYPRSLIKLKNGIINISSENIPMTYDPSTGRIDHMIFNDLVKKIVDKLKELGFTEDDFIEKEVLLTNISTSLFSKGLNQKTYTLKGLSLILYIFLQSELKRILFSTTYSGKEFFSGELFNNINSVLLPSVDLDLEKWYDIEYKKLNTAMSHLLKGTVNGVSYNLDPRLSFGSVFLDDKSSYDSINNIIKPHFVTYIEVKLSTLFQKEDKNYDIVSDHINNKLTKFGIDVIKFR